MRTLVIETFIEAPKRTCFDLSRSVEVHEYSMAHTGEKAVAGTTTGLMEKGDFVTWRARHLGITQELTSRIVRLNKPDYFRDVMITGIFRSMVHDHYYHTKTNGTLMIDVFRYEMPFGVLGLIADYLFVCRYVTSLLLCRNSVIKREAESRASTEEE
jgi:ligand-binding SRPBCC domain-containing protein